MGTPGLAALLQCMKDSKQMRVLPAVEHGLQKLMPTGLCPILHLMHALDTH